MCTQHAIDNLDDDLGDVFAGLDREALPADQHRPLLPIISKPAHVEPCRKCGGSGVFRGYSGASLGPCFKCKGAGSKTFKTSAEHRAKAKVAAANKADQARATLQQAVVAWQAANPAEWAWMRAASARGFEFADSLVETLGKYGKLSPAQLSAAQDCMAKDKARQEAKLAEAASREANAQTVDIAAIETAFAQAGERGVKRPKLRLDSFLFKPAPLTGRNAGAIYVTDTTRTDADGEQLYLGKIVAGKLITARGCDPEAEARIIAAAGDPRAAAIAYGQRTGSCSVCSRELTDKASVDLGIGPVCATKYGF